MTSTRSGCAARSARASGRRSRTRRRRLERAPTPRATYALIALNVARLPRRDRRRRRGGHARAAAATLIDDGGLCGRRRPSADRRRRRRVVPDRHRRLPPRRACSTSASTCSSSTSSARCSSRRSAPRASSASTSSRCSPARSARCCLDPNELTVGASGAVFGLMAAAFLIARDRGLDELASQIGFFVVHQPRLHLQRPGHLRSAATSAAWSAARWRRSLVDQRRARRIAKTRAPGRDARVLVALCAVAGRRRAGRRRVERRRPALGCWSAESRVDARALRLEAARHSAARMPAAAPVDRLGVEQVGEQLDAVDQARARARERRGGVDGDDPLGAERAQPLAHGRAPARPPRPRRGRRASRRRPPGRAARELLPGDDARLRPRGRRARRSPPASCDHLRHPVAADEDRVEPLERRDPRACGAPATAAPTASSRPRSVGAQALARARGSPVASPSARQVVEHLVEGLGVEREHPRARSASRRPPRGRRRRRRRRPRTAPG